MAGKVKARMARLRQRWPLFDVLYRTYEEGKVDGERRMAAEVTYYAFFSLFPLLMVFATILEAAFGEKSEKILDSVLAELPVLGPDIVQNVGSPQGTGVVAVVGLLVALWAGTRAFESFGHAIEVVWEGPAVEPSSTIMGRLRGLITMAILGGAILATTIIGSILASIDLMPGLVKPMSFVLSVALNAGVLLLAFKVLAPGNPTWRSQLPGAVVGGIGWALLQVVGSYFVRYIVKGASDTYGAFAVVIGLLTWINVQVRLMLYAAELNSVLARTKVRPEPANVL
jgi:membrane protein